METLSAYRVASAIQALGVVREAWFRNDFESHSVTCAMVDLGVLQDELLRLSCQPIAVAPVSDKEVA